MTVSGALWVSASLRVPGKDTERTAIFSLSTLWGVEGMQRDRQHSQGVGQKCRPVVTAPGRGPPAPPRPAPLFRAASPQPPAAEPPVHWFPEELGTMQSICFLRVQDIPAVAAFSMCLFVQCIPAARWLHWMARLALFWLLARDSRTGST
jgi:hypothetical protein